ncbi:PaNoxR NADPH oxidase activator encoded by the PaNoxR protein [Cercophora samala]|uniref:PaNoxR NADPH oxidase activator encoded by the PaNoxR protein n=1 Tax=Cercophora samala TaxID=330535 RepID=A0AA40DBN1_9PEZI|nr:PaNoxR NADPH oxidase activator encoded by the PaNoxR protein [Cercophora samala]
MSLKQEIETWVEALKYYDNNEFDEALQAFERIADTSKILFNMGVINATLGQHEQAVECYQRAVKLDQYLAVAYFQQGVSNFLLGDFEEALANFNDTLLYLRGNTLIDYGQLGLIFKLYSCEVLFNRGLCYIYLEQMEAGMQDLQYAVKEKVVEDHNVINDAIRDEAKGYTVFSIPVGVVYRPNEAKVRNLQQKDYLGKARLVAASDRANAFTGFAGAEMKQSTGPIEVKDDRPQEALSFAASNLVKPGLQSRRQQSEPPNSRNVFPPTPPPENDKPAQPSRAASVRNGPKPVPSRLNLEKSRPSDRYEKASPDEGPRDQQRRPSRSASAAAPPSRGYSQREPPSRRRKEEEEDTYNDDLYDMYQGGGGSRNSRSQRSNRGGNQPRDRYIEEEDEEGSDYDDGSFDEGDFEMMAPRRPGPGSVSGGSKRGSSRRDALRTIRVKVHANDVRYIMVGPAVEFPDFAAKIREKFNIPSRGQFLIKFKDEDSPELITMVDQDDLEMVMSGVRQNARKARSETGKMEVWVELQ